MQTVSDVIVKLVISLCKQEERLQYVISSVTPWHVARSQQSVFMYPAMFCYVWEQEKKSQGIVPVKCHIPPVSYLLSLTAHSNTPLQHTPLQHSTL